MIERIASNRIQAFKDQYGEDAFEGYLEQNDKTEEEIKEMGIDFLPANLDEAIKELENDEIVKESLGESYKHYRRIKKEEILRFSREITDWELKNYLDY